MKDPLLLVETCWREYLLGLTQSQFEQMSKQLEDVTNIGNPVDEERQIEYETRDTFTRTCNECNKKFKWMTDLFKHMLSEHKPINAGETDPMWYMMGELVAEVRDEQVVMREEYEDFSRGVSQAMRLLTQTLTQDMTKNIQRILASHGNTIKSKLFVCNVCSYESETETGMKMHVHCGDCNIRLSSMQELSKHKQTIHKDKPEEEKDLKRKVMEMETLQIEVNNMKTMLKEQSQELQIKNAIIESYKDVEKQKVQTKSPVVLEQNKKEGAPKMDKIDKHICNACDKLFRTNIDLDNHVRAKHKGEEPLEVSTSQNICPHCGEIVSNNIELQKHKYECEIIHKVSKFRCTDCKVAFSSHDEMMDHLSQVHLTEAQRTGQGLHKYMNDDIPNKEWRPPLCRNGAKCYYHKQHRCQFFHHHPPPRQQVRHYRQAPTDQWQQVPTLRKQVQNEGHFQDTQKQHQQGQLVQNPHEQQTQGHKYWSVPPQGVVSTPWCLHGRGCPMGQYCVLRHEDFPNLHQQGHQ